MTSERKFSTIDANQQLHSKLAMQYEADEPHFKSENREKVRVRLSEVARLTDPCRTMIDFGCGTGFLEELAPSEIEVIYGVDVTEAMLDILRNKVIPRLRIITAPVEDVPLPDRIADLVTGYSVLDHFGDPNLVFREAARLLRPGGVLYMDLLPNEEFWRGVRSIGRNRTNLSAIVEREVSEVASHGEKMFNLYGVSREVLAAAEPHKETSDGFSTESLVRDLDDSGFEEINIRLDWFLGEAVVLHRDGVNMTKAIADHLRVLTPLSSHLFKYIWFTAKRKS